jgi:hypothetical protein
MEIMPSMRAMMTAGPALDRCNVGAYNCAYLPVDSPRSFDECMYILMCGTGVGFSVEKNMYPNFPALPKASKKPTQLLLLRIVKKDGASPSVNYSPYLLLVESPDGMCREYDLLVQDSRHLEEELQDPNLLFDFLTLVSDSLRGQPVVVSLPLKHTT